MFLPSKHSSLPRWPKPLRDELPPPSPGDWCLVWGAVPILDISINGTLAGVAMGPMGQAVVKDLMASQDFPLVAEEGDETTLVPWYGWEIELENGPRITT